jgi:hypothetical protein
MVPFCLHAVANTPAGLIEFVRSYDSISFGLPQNRGGSAPALVFSRPAPRLLTLRPARSPSRQCDLLHRRLQQLCYLRRCFDCYRVERTSSRTGLTPAVDHHLSRRTRLCDLPGVWPPLLRCQWTWTVIHRRVDSGRLLLRGLVSIHRKTCHPMTYRI